MDDLQTAVSDPVSLEALISQTNALTKRILADAIAEDEFDRLPFGAIELDTQGKILKYNAFESRISGVKRANAVGKNFFAEVAPCTVVKQFYGRFKEGVKKGDLHEKFRFHFAFVKNPVDVNVTLFYCDLTMRVWVFVRPIMRGR